MELIDLRNGLTVADLLTLAGNAVVVSILVELIKRTFQMSDAAIKRFAPVMACTAGTILGVLAAIFLSGDPVQGALTGFLAGAVAAGLYDVAAGQIAAIFTKLPIGGTPPTPPPAGG